MTLTFQCYAYRSRETWEAICVDLDIAVFGGSAKEVVTSLETGIRMHLESVSELPAEEQDHLLARRAPWYVSAKLAMSAWLARLRGDSKRVLRFTIAMLTLESMRQYEELGVRTTCGGAEVARTEELHRRI